MRFCLIAVLILAFCADASVAGEWFPVSGHLSDIGDIAPDTKTGSVVFSSSGGLYRVDLRTRQSDLFFALPVSDSYVYDLMVNDGRVYAAAGKHLYAVADSGQSEIIYQASEDETSCRSVILAGGRVFVGTGNGVKFKRFDDVVWSSLDGMPRRAVIRMRADGDYLYIISDGQVIRHDLNFSHVDVVFSESSGSSEILQEDGEESQTQDVLRDLFIQSTEEGHRLILAADSGIYVSEDAGDSWDLIPGSLTLAVFIDSITDCPDGAQDCFWAAGRGGIRQFSQDTWSFIGSDLASADIHDILKTKGGVYASTDRGVFYFSDGKAFSPLQRFAGGAGSFSNEPEISQLHRMAVDYAEVYPDKIKRWRTSARRRAILPDVSLGLDRDASELLHWDTGSSPDRLLNGDEFVSWDVSFSWDLGDLIWNPDQTSIDSRSKLMVELREDIIHQVTRIYFERRRLQYQLASLTLEQDIFETRMKIDELTALLDGYTGGQFSQNIH